MKKNQQKKEDPLSKGAVWSGIFLPLKVKVCLMLVAVLAPQSEGQCWLLRCGGIRR